MAKGKLIPEPPDTDKTGPKGRFAEIASKVFSVPKDEIDEREKRWHKTRDGQKNAASG
jgi:hypothetical protein